MLWSGTGHFLGNKIEEFPTTKVFLEPNVRSLSVNSNIHTQSVTSAWIQSKLYSVVFFFFFWDMTQGTRMVKLIQQDTSRNDLWQWRWSADWQWPSLEAANHVDVEQFIGPLPHTLRRNTSHSQRNWAIRYTKNYDLTGLWAKSSINTSYITVKAAVSFLAHSGDFLMVPQVRL